MGKYNKYKAYKGNVIYSQSKDVLISKEMSYILVLDEVIKEICNELPEDFSKESIID
jgi:hypothetical protein